MKKLNRIPKSDAVFEILAAKSLGNKKIKIDNSSRQRAVSESVDFIKSDKLKDKCGFFNNLPELLRLELAASILGVSPKTIYDWHYRCKQRKIPDGLFVNLNRLLFVRTSVLQEWIASQNPSLQCEIRRGDLCRLQRKI